MQSVSSDAVARALGTWETIATDNSTYSIKGIETANGKYLSIHLHNYYFTYGQSIATLPAKWRPYFVTRFLVLVRTATTYIIGFSNISNDGSGALFCDDTGGDAFTDMIVKIFEDF